MLITNYLNLLDQAAPAVVHAWARCMHLHGACLTASF